MTAFNRDLFHLRKLVMPIQAQNMANDETLSSAKTEIVELVHVANFLLKICYGKALRMG